MTYEEAVEYQFQYLKEQLKNRRGVEQGYLCYDDMGNVINRVGRMSYNPIWYREFYSKYNKAPNKKELRALAEKHVREGFYDETGFIPPFHYW